MSPKSKLDLEVLEQSVISLQLRRENNTLHGFNDTLREAIDALAQAHARLSEDLTQKNGEIAHLESCCSDLKLQTAELSEKVYLTELKLSGRKDSDIRAGQVSELSTECVVLRDTNSAADSDVAALHCELHSHTNTVRQKQIEINDLQQLLSAECKKTRVLSEQLAEEQNQLILKKREVAASCAVNRDLTAQNADLQRKLELAERECSYVKLSLSELREKSDNANKELQHQLLCLQSDCQQKLQSLHVVEERNEVLRMQCDRLTTENANLKLQALEHAEMQAKIEKLEQALQDNVTALAESEKMTEVHLREKDIMQNKLLDAENEKKGLHAELRDIKVLYQNSEESLLEIQERLVQRDKQVEEKDHGLACCEQATAYMRKQLVALQCVLEQEESEKVERKYQMKVLKKEVEKLNQIIATQNGTVSEALAAKAENGKLTAALQHQTSEKVSLEQQVRELEDKNSSLQKELSVITGSYELANKLAGELRLRVDQLCTNEQKFSDQLSSLTLSCGQRDDVILQLNSEKEEMSRSLTALTQKAEANALERAAHMTHISELEEQVSVVGDKMEKLAMEKLLLNDELSTCKDVIEQQKQSVAEAKHESEHFHKVILDFEEQSVCWRGEKCILEARIRELESCVASKEKEVLSLKEMHVVERTDIDDFPFTGELDVLRKCEFVQNLDTIEEESEEAETEKDAYNDFASEHNLHLESDIGNLGECQSLSTNLQEMCKQTNAENQAFVSMSVTGSTKVVHAVTDDALLTVKQVSSSEDELQCDIQIVDQINSSNNLEKVNLQPEMSKNAEMQHNERFELVKGAVGRVDENGSLSKSIGGHASTADCDQQHNPAMVCYKSLSVSDSRESSMGAVCVKDGNVNKRPSGVEEVSSDDRPTKLARIPVSTVADTASKRLALDKQRDGERRVIKRFTRLPRPGAAASRQNNKPLSVCSSNIPSLHTHPTVSLDMNTRSTPDAVKWPPGDTTLPSNDNADTSSIGKLSSEGVTNNVTATAVSGPRRMQLPRRVATTVNKPAAATSFGQKDVHDCKMQ